MQPKPSYQVQAATRKEKRTKVGFIILVIILATYHYFQIPYRPYQFSFCLCNNDSEPNCSNRQSVQVKVKKSKAFNVSLIVKDQLNHSIPANTSSFPFSHDGSTCFSEGWHTRSLRVVRKCTNLTFNVFYRNDSDQSDGACVMEVQNLPQTYVSLTALVQLALNLLRGKCNVNVFATQKYPLTSLSVMKLLSHS